MRRAILEPGLVQHIREWSKRTVCHYGKTLILSAGIHAVGHVSVAAKGVENGRTEVGEIDTRSKG